MAEILGDAWRAPKVGRCQVGWDMRRGVFLLSRLWGLGERCELPWWGPGRAPVENGFWHILKVTEHSFCTYMTI